MFKFSFTKIRRIAIFVTMILFNLSFLSAQTNNVIYNNIDFYYGGTYNSQNPDNLIMPGKTVRFKIQIKNNLTTNILAGAGEISTSNPNITILDGKLNFNNVISGQSGWSTDECEIFIKESATILDKLSFTLTATNNFEPKGPWTSNFEFPLPPLLKVGSVFIDDDNNPDSKGNNNKIIEKGETIEIIPLLNNISNEILKNVNGKLTTSDAGISVWNNKQGANTLVRNSWRYKIVSNSPQSVNPDENNIQPEQDFVFDYNTSSSNVIMNMIISAEWSEKGVLMKWQSSIAFKNGIIETPPAAPTAITGSASSITYSSALLNSAINANGATTTVTFEYGLTTNYGNIISATPNTFTGTTNTAVSASITGLNESTLYHYRVKAVNSEGTIYGSDMSFTTLGDNIKTFSGHTYGVFSVSFSPDGTKLASGSADKTIKLWNLNSGVLLNTLTGHNSTVWSVSFSPDGTKIASGSNDGTIKIWNVSAGSLLNTINVNTYTSQVKTISFSPDGTRLASDGSDKTIKIWNVSTGSLLNTFTTGHTDAINSISFSPDGTKLASGSMDNTIKILNASNGSLVRTLTGHTSWVNTVTFSPDGTKLVSGGSSDGTVNLWNVNTGSLLNTLTGHTSSVFSVAFSPGGTKIASGSLDGTIKIWNVITGKLVNTFSGHTQDIRSVAFSRDGNTIASGSSDKTIKIWSAATLDIEEKTNKTSRQYLLNQNYPNPFNPSTIISYQLQDNSYVSLIIYDVLGKEVVKPVSGNQVAGRYEVQWNASGVPTGIYYYKLQVGGYMEMKKMVYIR